MPKLLNLRYPEGWYFENCDNTELKRSSKINCSVSERISLVGRWFKKGQNKQQTFPCSQKKKLRPWANNVTFFPYFLPHPPWCYRTVLQRCKFWDRFEIKIEIAYTSSDTSVLKTLTNSKLNVFFVLFFLYVINNYPTGKKTTAWCHTWSISLPLIPNFHSGLTPTSPRKGSRKFVQAARKKSLYSESLLWLKMYDYLFFKRYPF